MSSVKEKVATLSIGNAPDMPWLFVLPEDTFESVKAQYETQMDETLTDEEFKALLPSLNVIVGVVHDRGGTVRNPWIDSYTKKR